MEDCPKACDPEPTEIATSISKKRRFEDIDDFDLSTKEQVAKRIKEVSEYLETLTSKMEEFDRKSQKKAKKAEKKRLKQLEMEEIEENERKVRKAQRKENRRAEKLLAEQREMFATSNEVEEDAVQQNAVEEAEVEEDTVEENAIEEDEVQQEAVEEDAVEEDYQKEENSDGVKEVSPEDTPPHSNVSSPSPATPMFCFSD